MNTSIKAGSMTRFAKRCSLKATIQSILLGTVASVLAVTTGQSATLYTVSLSGTVGSYNSFSGTAINASLISGLNEPYAIAADSTNIYVGDGGAAKLLKYNSSGGLVAPTFPDTNAISLSLYGGDIYDVAGNAGVIRKYNTSSGNYSLVAFTEGAAPYGITLDTVGSIYYTSGDGQSVHKLTNAGDVIPAFSLDLTGFTPWGIALDGAGNLFVSTLQGTIGKYNATTGAIIDSNYITGLSSPRGLSIHDGVLYVAEYSASRIGSYNTVGGLAINPNLVVGQNFIDVAVIPEPSSIALLGFGAFGILMWARKRNLLARSS